MQRPHRKAHAVIWTIISLVLPVSLVIAFLASPRLSHDAPAVRLDAAEGTQQ